MEELAHRLSLHMRFPVRSLQTSDIATLRSDEYLSAFEDDCLRKPKSETLCTDAQRPVRAKPSASVMDERDGVDQPLYSE